MRVVLAALVALLAPLAAAQQSATTESGRSVLLYEDGTWTYADSASVARPSVADTVAKPLAATDSVVGKHGTYSLHYDPSLWAVSPSVSNPVAEYELLGKSGEVYAVVIHERLPIPMEQLPEIVLMNARGAATNVTVVEQQPQIVNGTEMIAMELHGLMNDLRIEFAYLARLHADERGALQVIAYTSKTLLREYRAEMEALLAGVVIEPAP